MDSSIPLEALSRLILGNFIDGESDLRNLPSLVVHLAEWGVGIKKLIRFSI